MNWFWLDGDGRFCSGTLCTHVKREDHNCSSSMPSFFSALAENQRHIFGYWRLYQPDRHRAFRETDRLTLTATTSNRQAFYRSPTQDPRQLC